MGGFVFPRPEPPTIRAIEALELAGHIKTAHGGAVGLDPKCPRCEELYWVPAIRMGLTPVDLHDAWARAFSAVPERRVY